MAEPAPLHRDPNALPVPESVLADGRRVSCDGGGGALGHPRVWYEISDRGFVDCGYCDRRFVLRGGPADSGAA